MMPDASGRALQKSDAPAPRNARFEERCRDSFARQGAMALIGARMRTVEPGRCEIHLPYREDLSQQHGYFHGGIVTTIADSAAGYAAFSLVDSDTSVLSVEFKVNFLSPAHGELLVASGTVLKPGRTLSIVEARVDVERDGERAPCATMLQTVMNLSGRAER